MLGSSMKGNTSGVRSYARKLYKSLSKNGLRRSIAELSIILGAVHIVSGVVLIADPGDFGGRGFYELVDFMPFALWGAVFLIVGLTLLTAGIKRRSNLARIGLMGYLTIQWIWALSFMYFTFEHSDIGVVNFLQWMTGPAVVYSVLRHSVNGSEE